MFWSTVLSVCVYFSLVTSQQCPEYSTYADCGCMLSCENPYPSDECSENCEPGCYCNPGYFLRSDGHCVLQSQCVNPREYPPNTQDTSYQQCGQDEEYYDCTPSCKNTCENFNNQGVRCNCAPPGCFCREGLVKREDGKCVPPQECAVPPPDCPPNAIYIPCGSACAPTCEDPRLRSCDDKCVASCFCKPGYLLSKDGKGCVPPQYCNLKDIPMPAEPKCPEYSVFIQCGSACAPTCKNMYPEPCGDECVTACFCIPGYLMNINGTRCVRPDQCEKTPVPPPPPPTPDYPTKCTENAVYQDCGTSCPKTCEDSYPSRCTLECVAGCFCKTGFLQRKDGKCVTKEQCDGKNRCDADEQYYDCTPSCRNTCKNHNRPGVKCGCGPPGCFCREGLVKREDGKCVIPSQCPNRCDADEQYYDCTPSCRNTCKNHNRPGVKCGCGPPGCFCREGLVKREDGKCVIPSQCPNRCDADEQYYDCTPSCRNTCKNHNRPGVKCGCGPPGCFCREGLVKREDGKCVRPNQCPNRCDADEQYYDCTPSCRNTCKNHNRPGVKCECGPPGCYCREGLVKREDGKCVRPNQCPNRCDADEQYYDCTPSCRNTCKNHNRPGVKCGCGPPGCFCREGLVKREDGKCVRPNQCPITPPKCMENAMFVSCGSSCPPTCDYPRPHPCSQRCVAGCFCKHGFLQTKDGKCVLPQQCQKKNVTRCRANAEYLECGPACPETCEHTQPQKPCIAACLPGCFCKSGFVKTKYGNCVPPSLCDKKCSLPEEEYVECGSTCPDTCDNIGHMPPGGCPYKCVRGCFCKKGLLRDLKGACVTLKDCPAQVTSASTETATTSPAYGVIFGESRGCPDRKLCEAFCKSHKLRFGYCVGADKKECHCS